jgi:hypothetical protein
MNSSFNVQKDIKDKLIKKILYLIKKSQEEKGESLAKLSARVKKVIEEEVK